jgi:hypothetical protein
VGAAARKPAKALARLLYRDPALRPTIDEATARTLVGEAPACPEPPTHGPRDASRTAEPATATPACSAKVREIQDVLETLPQDCAPRCDASSVPRRLLTSLGRELGVELVIAVQTSSPVGEGEPAAIAQLLRVSDGRFVPMVLSPAPGQGGAESWDEVLPVVRSLAAQRAQPAAERPQPGGAATAASLGPRQSSPSKVVTEQPSEQQEESRVLSSPWFWGGLGVLVAAGVVVFAVSRSSLSEPASVRLDGRVSP